MFRRHAAGSGGADLRNADDLSLFGRLNGTRHWRIFRQGEMTTAVMITAEETRKW